MEVTVGDERFNRHYRRISLALRLVSHGARAQTASEWSGLTPDRLITLRRRWLPDAGDGFRGPAPTSFLNIFRSEARAIHATLFASIHHVLHRRSTMAERARQLEPCIENGERLCEAYEIFREWEADAALEFDQAVLIARGTTRCEDIELMRCVSCRRALLLDKWAPPRRTPCPECRRKQRRQVSP